MLVEADPGDLQIVCNAYNVDTIPEVETEEEEQVLNVLEITKHPGYSPGTEEDFGSNIKGPFNGYDISVYQVDDTNLQLEEGKLWPACLPRLEEESSSNLTPGPVSVPVKTPKSSSLELDFFAGWMDPEPAYRAVGTDKLANRIIDYFYPRKTLVQKVSCADPKWMRSNTYYPPATVCYKDPSESSCFQNGNSGSSVMTHFKAKVDETSFVTVDAFAFTGPLSMHKGCDQVRKDPSVWGDYLVLTKLILISFRHWC